MATSKTYYKSFVAVPKFVLDKKTGEVLNSENVLNGLKDEIQSVNDYALYVARNDEKLMRDIDTVTGPPAGKGHKLGLKIHPDLQLDGKVSGKSRKEKLFRYNAVVAAQLWSERIKAVNGTSGKYISQGYKRTMNAGPPSWDSMPYLNMGAVDKSYCLIENNPFEDGELILNLVVQGRWRTLIFDFDPSRFDGANRISNPLVWIDKNGTVKFTFSVEYEKPVVQFSSEYIVGVDVGINQYATVSVVQQDTGEVMYSTTLSRRVHSLWNSVRATKKQVSRLQQLRRPLEASLHRAKNKAKRRELAILAAQEIANISYTFDNAVVCFEDLSFQANTMKFGRWNRGDLVRWTEHYISQNGGWLVKVNAYNTSKVCHCCGRHADLSDYHMMRCRKCDIALDRDVNASINIAKNGVTKTKKAITTRSKNKRLRKARLASRTPKTRNSLKYPGRDRTKNRPTPRQVKPTKHKEVKLGLGTDTCSMATVVSDGFFVFRGEESGTRSAVRNSHIRLVKDEKI